MLLFDKLIKIKSKQYFDFFVLFHILSGVVTYVLLKSNNFSLESIIILGNLAHFVYEYNDYNKHYVLYDDNLDIMEKMRKALLSKNLLSSINTPPNPLTNSICDQIGHNIGLLIGYIYFDKLKEHKNIFVFCLTFFLIGKIYLMVEFSSLKIKNFKDLKEFVKQNIN